VDAGAALRVEAPPAEAPVEVFLADGLEAACGVDRLDALADVEAVVLLLDDLVGVEGLGAVDLPLALGAGGAGGLGDAARGARRRLGGAGCGRGHGVPSVGAWCVVRDPEPRK